MPGFDILFKNTNLLRGPIVRVANICTVSLDNSATLLTAVKHDDNVYPCFAVIINSVTCQQLSHFFQPLYSCGIRRSNISELPGTHCKKVCGHRVVQNRTSWDLEDFEPHDVRFFFSHRCPDRKWKDPEHGFLPVHSQKYREMYCTFTHVTTQVYFTSYTCMHYIYCTGVNSSIGRVRLPTQEDAENVEGRAVCRLHIMLA
jgi:hypothetical protein